MIILPEFFYRYTDIKRMIKCKKSILKIDYSKILLPLKYLHYSVVKTYTAECHTQPSNVRALRREGHLVSELRHKHHKNIKTEIEEC